MDEERHTSYHLISYCLPPFRVKYTHGKWFYLTVSVSMKSFVTLPKPGRELLRLYGLSVDTRLHRYSPDLHSQTRVLSPDPYPPLDYYFI